MISTDISVWIAAFLTISILTFLIRYNPVFRFTEATGIAVMVAWVVVGALKNLLDMAIIPIANGNLLLLIPVTLGILLFSKFFREYTYMSRFGTSVVIGVGIGLSMRGALQTQIVGQILSTSFSLSTGSAMEIFSNLVLLIVVITVLMNFFFTVEHKGGLGIIAKTGRYALMITFGAMYGASIMGRLSVLVSRLQFLFWDWLGIGL